MAAQDSESEDEAFSIFQEPETFRPPPPKPTTVSYTLQRGSPTLNLRLVGSSPLWGHILWHTATTLAGYLEARPWLVKDKTVLELGAGAGLPGLLSAILGARQVCITDYPDADLIENLELNVRECASLWRPETKIVAEGFLWGSTPGPKMNTVLGDGFDTLILSDLLFNHSEHTKLVATVKSCMKRCPPNEQESLEPKEEYYSRALVFFTPHRPWLYEKDLGFFDIARQEGLVAEKVFEEVLDKPMFAEDRGDEKMRRTVEGWEVRWP